VAIDRFKKLLTRPTIDRIGVDLGLVVMHNEKKNLIEKGVGPIILTLVNFIRLKCCQGSNKYTNWNKI